MATTPRQEAWIAAAPGRAMNPDKTYGQQCKDVADDYSIWLFGDWVTTLRAEDAALALDKANGDYFDKVYNEQANANLIPQRGDLIIYGPCKAVPEGHIAVVLQADSKSVQVVEQDGYTVRYDAWRNVINQGKPAYVTTHGYQLPDGALCIGWLRPKQSKIIDNPIGDDMDAKQVSKDLYQILTGSIPDDSIIQQKADYITKDGNIQQVLKDILAAGRWQNWEQANLWATSSYQEARLNAGDGLDQNGKPYDKDQYAKDRFYGGDDFRAVMGKDMPWYIARSAQLDQLLEKDPGTVLTDQDRKDLEFGKQLRTLLKGL